MNYQAHALHSSFERGRKSGFIVIDTEALTFRTGETETSVTLPLQGLEISLGGAGNRLIYFRHPDHPDWTLYSDDQKILENPFLVKTAACAEATKALKKKRLFSITSVVAFLFCIAMCAIGAYFGLHLIARVAANSVPPQYEAKIGKKLFALVTADKHFLELPKELTAITDPLTQAVTDKDFSFDFYLIEDSSINAFALPGGRVVIHSGLLLNATSAEEVAGVLAHEISHVTQRHHIRGLVNRTGTVLLVQAIFGDASALLATLSELGGDLSSLKNSRAFELEADHSGWELLKRAKINPHGMISFFQTLKKEQNVLQKTIEENLSFLSTHPETEERIQVLNALWQKEGKTLQGHTLQIDYKQVKQEVEAAVRKAHRPEQDSGSNGGPNP
ncbi:MAG: M48 family metallopeptidase [Candidatus Electrothrix aestuarii]|uniref:M48 family metallopeptidase n=1 Tax=Candidatus Electrothrix aestuarii TaxID=3062594 RepID=A0AAU8M2M7_9BACT|nr:M48 family metallopeptidase [Candidatus Electrothrix aestuarii]